MRDGRARLRDGGARLAVRVGQRLRYACATASTTLPAVSERLRRVRYEPGKGPITLLLGPSRRCFDRGIREASGPSNPGIAVRLSKLVIRTLG